MSTLIKKNDWPLCICFDDEGCVYCADKQHMSGWFLRSELEELKSAINKTLALYKKNNITDDYINIKDEEAIKKEFSQFRGTPHKSKDKEKRNDDLYLIQNTNTLSLKIGRSKNVKGRLRQLQTSCEDKLVILFVIKNKGDIEDEVKDKFKNLCLTGEWFSFDEKIVNFYTKLSL